MLITISPSSLRISYLLLKAQLQHGLWPIQAFINIGNWQTHWQINKLIFLQKVFLWYVFPNHSISSAVSAAHLSWLFIRPCVSTDLAGHFLPTSILLAWKLFKDKGYWVNISMFPTVSSKLPCPRLGLNKNLHFDTSRQSPNTYFMSVFMLSKRRKHQRNSFHIWTFSMCLSQNSSHYIHYPI